MYSLLIDCSHRRNFIGLFQTEKEWIASQYFEGLPLEALSPKIRALLNSCSIEKTAIDHFYTPSNPGSQLGIRLTQIFVQSWIKTLCPSAQWTQYNGLYMSARCLADKKNATDQPHYIITEKGRIAWSTLSMDSDFPYKPMIRALDTSTVGDLLGTVYYLPQVKRWQAPPRPVLEIDYAPEQFLKFIMDLHGDNFDSTHLHESETEYAKWHAPNFKN